MNLRRITPGRESYGYDDGSNVSLAPLIILVLPDHWHAVWTMPPHDVDYAECLRLVKPRFTKEILQTGVNIAKDDRGEYKLGQKRYWEHTIRDDQDFEAHVN